MLSREGGQCRCHPGSKFCSCFLFRIFCTFVTSDDTTYANKVKKCLTRERGTVVGDKGKKPKIAGKPSIHNVDYLFGQTDEYLILNMIS